jgi:hypothetical protein
MQQKGAPRAPLFLSDQDNYLASSRKPKSLREKVVASNSENNWPVMQKIAHGA